MHAYSNQVHFLRSARLFRHQYLFRGTIGMQTGIACGSTLGIMKFVTGYALQRRKE